ncbi:hypothetical protein DFJ58DRAFT_862800 [Suillus subalutaceus]|uniref:uncharacterized protein n=1 Tax=Suillus subalutaceus TaxID=48586 RepID=UPI001B86BAA3|nr:uncharacterized protein DFJ58DRAFT_862800 [Suillus subalutaceus]KAG1837630.1 hypothetical protein DFJ58DRAFT_862800 [Suillus subalutaceus]
MSSNKLTLHTCSPSLFTTPATKPAIPTICLVATTPSPANSSVTPWSEPQPPLTLILVLAPKTPSSDAIHRRLILEQEWELGETASARKSRMSPDGKGCGPALGEADMRSLKNAVGNKIGRDLELVLAILPTSSTDVYHAIKSFGDVIASFPTQCVQENKIERANDQYCANLGMKINAKIGGINSLPRSGALENLSALHQP